MKRVLAFSLSLVAFSGGAGLGLSILHDYSTTVQTAMLASPEIQSDAASGFVIPQYVPTVTTAAVTAPALPTLAAPAALDLPELGTQTAATVRPRMRSEAVMALAAPETDDVLPAARQSVTAHADIYAPSARAKARAKASQVYVAQAFRTIDGFTPQNGPEYVVGVYR